MNRLKRLAALMLAVILILSMGACAVRVPDPKELTSEDEAAAMGFKKGNFQDVIGVGMYAYFDVIIKSEYDYEVQWSSSDPKIATVDSNGRVDGKSAGKVTIVASAKKAKVEYEVTIKKVGKQPVSMSTALTGNNSWVETNLESQNGLNPYAILINSATGCATVYTYNETGVYRKAVRAMVCSVGKEESTRIDSYRVESTERWDKGDDGRYYQYVTKIGDYTISSTPYKSNASASLITEEYNKLGTACTDGNIWFSVADAKWIYENCDVGTLIKVTDTKGQDPFGVPSPLKLTDNSKSLKWDPTDDNESNPYNKLTPTFEGVEPAQVKLNDIFDVHAGIVAYDTCGNKVTDGIKVEGSVPCNREGSYVVSYYYTDDLHRTARADRVITVVDVDD